MLRAKNRLLRGFLLTLLATVLTAEDATKSAWESTNAFADDVPAYGSSATAARDDERIVDLCLKVCFLAQCTKRQLLYARRKRLLVHSARC